MVPRDRARSEARVSSGIIPPVQGTSPPEQKFDGLGLLQDDVGPAPWVALLLFSLHACFVFFFGQ
jgi:hypothetical protein